MRFEKGRTPHGAKPFRKGQSGNPNGRPRDTSITSYLAKEMSREVRMAISRNKNGHLIFESMPAAEALARKIWHHLLYAKRICVPLLELVIRYTEGPPPSREEIEKRDRSIMQEIDFSVLTDKEFREFRRLQRKLLNGQHHPRKTMETSMRELASEPYQEDIEYKILGQIPEKIIQV